MAYILQIETTTTNCSVALSNNGVTVAVKEISDGYSHAENLHVFIKDILESNNLKYSELKAIAVSKGPGSYTGLRIGVSTAKGLCFALDIPLIAIDTLQSLAIQVNESSGLIIPMLDARRMEAYTAVFDSSYTKLREVKAEILTEASFLEYLEENTVYFIGNSVEKLENILKHKNAVFLKEVLPSANDMSSLVFDKFQQNEVEDVAYFEPYYLKDFIITPSKKKI